MPGHVFILRGDIRQVACDAWLIPCDRRGRADRFLPDAWKGRFEWPAPPPDFANFRRRVFRAPWSWDERQAWMVNVGYEGQSQQSEADFYRQSIEEALREVFVSLTTDHAPLHRREIPLLAMPLLGGGHGMPMVEKGATLGSLLEIVYEELRRTDRRLDVALVTLGARAYAAAQHDRARLGAESWTDLTGEDFAQAEALAGHALRGNLALFMGAGIGVGAGLPGWQDLLEKLADKAHLEGSLRKSLMAPHRAALDQASFLENRFGGLAELQQKVVEVIREGGEGYSLTHALLAALPVKEAITTNYDRLFEAAWEWAAAERSPARHGRFHIPPVTSIIPYNPRPDSSRWLLKLHGCVNRPDSIVLTREGYIRYNHQYAALEGILQAALLTRHMLFIGFSLRDDNFIRILDAVRRVVGVQEPEGRNAAGQAQPPFGTALMLGKDEVMQNLYQRDLNWVSLSERHELDMKGGDFAMPGRKLEIFLDYLLSRTASASHLMDPDFQSLLTEEELHLRDALALLAETARGHASPGSPSWAKVVALLAEFGEHIPPHAGG
jgi:hypothetical protein